MSDENKSARILLFEGIEHNKKLIKEHEKEIEEIGKKLDNPHLGELKGVLQWTEENRSLINCNMKKIAELKKDIEVLDEAIGGDQIDADNNESKFGLVKEINDLKEFDKGSQKWSVLIEGVLQELIFNYKKRHSTARKEMDELLEKLDSPTLEDPYYPCGKPKENLPEPMSWYNQDCKTCTFDFDEDCQESCMRETGAELIIKGKITEPEKGYVAEFPLDSHLYTGVYKTGFVEGMVYQKQKDIEEFENLIKRAVRNIRKKYPDNGQLVGLGYVETIFKREFNKLKEEKLE